MIFCFAAACLVGCGRDYEELEKDRLAIESYLDGQLRDTATYEETGGVYKYVPNIGRAGYADAAIAEKGDVVEFYYEGYAFERSLSLSANNYNPALIFATNRPETLDYLCDPAPTVMGEAAWERTLWGDEPVTITIGNTTVVEGVARGLAGSREGDVVWMLFASDLGFGEKELGAVGPNQILAYRIYINTVTKRE